MKQRLFIILALVSASLTTAWADNIQGKITSSAGNAVSFANVVAILKADSSFVDGVVADEDGHYNLEANPRLMLLRVSSIGYETKTVAISSPITNITLSESTNSLDEVTVRAKKPDFKITEEGMMTTITGTALARLGTGSEVLSHIPGVYKSGGGYGVFGRGGALVYLNGRKVINMSDVDNLRSEDIKSVEVITAPGSKYSASVYAVIKIVTHKPAGEGLGMNLRSSIYQGDNTDYYTSARWNYRSGKLDVFGFHSFSRNKTWSKSNLTQRVEADTLWNIALDQNTYVRSMSVSNQLGMNYQIDDNNFLGFRYILGTNPSSKSSNTIVSSVTANDNDFDHLTTQSHNTTTYQPSGLLNAYYEGKIGQAGISWDFDFMHNGSDSRSQQEEESTNQDDRLFASASSTRSLLVATKLASTLQIAKAKLSIGTEYSGARRKDTYSGVGSQIDASRSTTTEHHLSPFADFSYPLPFGQVSAGLRYERVWMHRENGTDEDDRRNYSNFYPNASFTAQFGKTQLGLFYNLKTRRPSYGQLSENIYYGNRFTYQGGNPFLKQERVHSLTLMGARGFFQCSVSYTDRRNAIIYWGEPYQESTSVTLISFTNLNSLKSVSGYASLSPQIGNWWPQLTAGISKQWLGMDTREGRRHFNTPLLSLQFSNTLELGKGWMATANMAYSSKGYSENLYMSRHIFSMNASIYKFLFDRKLTIYLSASDVFKSQKSGNNLYFYQTSTTQINRSDSREVSLTVKYNFNAAKSKYKGTGAGQGEKDRLQ